MDESIPGRGRLGGRREEVCRQARRAHGTHVVDDGQDDDRICAADDDVAELQRQPGRAVDPDLRRPHVAVGPGDAAAREGVGKMVAQVDRSHQGGPGALAQAGEEGAHAALGQQRGLLPRQQADALPGRPRAGALHDVPDSGRGTLIVERVARYAPGACARCRGSDRSTPRRRRVAPWPPAANRRWRSGRTARDGVAPARAAPARPARRPRQGL